MKILRKSLEKDSSGFVRLICQEEEDMWHVYNLIREGDKVKSSTFRKVTTESSTGSKTSQRLHLTLTIVVEMIDFDSTVCILHLKGKNVQESVHVRLGVYHTLDLELNRTFTLHKQEWDALDLHRLELCADIVNTADVAAVIMHEGLANICLISPSMTVVKSKIDMQIARKRKGLTAQHDKQMLLFFQAITTAFLRFVNLDLVKVVLVASPGFLREKFMDFLLNYSDKEIHKQILLNRPKFLLVHSSSGFKHALKEVLSDSTVNARLSDTKAQAEVKALNIFMELLSTDQYRAVYGFNHVLLASQQLAIETLMVSDSLFRSKDIELRRKYVKLVEDIRLQGSNVLIFSSMHVTGEQLTQLSGVAAILRFSIPDIDEWEDSVENGTTSDYEKQESTAFNLSNGN